MRGASGDPAPAVIRLGMGKLRTVFHVVPQIGRMGHQFVDGAVSFEPGMDIPCYAGASYQRGGPFVSGSGIDFHIRKFLCVVMLFAQASGALYPVVLRLQFRIGKIQHHDPPVHADAAVMLPDLLCDFPSATSGAVEHYQTARLRQNFAGHKTQCFGRCVRQQDAKRSGRQRYIHGSDQHKPLHLAMCVEVLQQDPVFRRPSDCRISALYSVRSRPVNLLFINTLRTIVHERRMDAVSPPVTHMNHRPDAKYPGTIDV